MAAFLLVLALLPSASVRTGLASSINTTHYEKFKNQLIGGSSVLRLFANKMQDEAFVAYLIEI